MGFVFCILNWEFRMAVLSILVFFIVTHLLLLHSAGCPESFDCGIHGKIRFPYTISTHPECGFVWVDCGETDQNVILGGKQYQVTGKLNNDSIEIKDVELERLISNKQSCDQLFTYIFFGTPPPFISFTISPNITLFKCMTVGDELIDKRTVEHFRGVHNHSECPGYTIYYKYPSYQVPTLGSYPHNCYVMQLPVVPPTENQDASDLLSLLAADFTIEFHVAEECLDCLLDWGHCSGTVSDFQCKKLRKVQAILLFLYLSEKWIQNLPSIAVWSMLSY